MDQLHGDRATWRFDGETLLIRYHTGRGTDVVLDALGQCVVPVAAIAAVELRTGQRSRRWRRDRGEWRLRVRLADGVDPYAAAGAALRASSDPFLLVGGADDELLAEYHADQLDFAAASARRTGGGPPPDLASRLVPALPLHIQTVEGTAGFDGGSVRLTWSGVEASSAKRKRQRREFPAADIARAEWVPVHRSEHGYLRIVPRAATDVEVTVPDKDLTCLCYRGDVEQARALLMAATITAHTRA